MVKTFEGEAYGVLCSIGSFLAGVTAELDRSLESDPEKLCAVLRSWSERFSATADACAESAEYLATLAPVGV